MVTTTAPRSRTVTERVVALLVAVGEAAGPVSLSELSRRSGLALTTTHRLAMELHRGGLLDRDPDGRFHVGVRLWEVASSGPRPLGLREAALPFMEDLYEATHENVQLAILDRDEAVYLERLAGRRSVHVVTRAGSRLPLHATGVGLVLLAHAPRDVRERVLRAPLQRFTRYTITAPVRLRSVLADVRRDGYVISDRQIETISMSVAAPITGLRGEVVAALSVVIAAPGEDPRRVVAAVRTAARGISRRLAGEA